MPYELVEQDDLKKMDLRTLVKIDPSPFRITYNDPAMFIGSCFASSIGKQFETGRLPVMINPSGTVFNPVSVCNTLDTITSGKKYESSDLLSYGGKWLSFNHYTNFSSDDPQAVLEKINTRTDEAAGFIANAKFLFITFGTARVYRWKKSGKIVSNCHKIPASEFTDDMLSVAEITAVWKNQLDRLKLLFPDLKIIFTVSPVRHWKSGAHGNNISKSVLFLAVEELLCHPSKPGYFPAYELLIDDLRDYRFYAGDMLHPSDTAIEYIWEAFSDCYFDGHTKMLWAEISSITRAMSHRIQTTSAKEIEKFAKSLLARIETVEKKDATINLDLERAYFQGLLSI